MIELSYLWRVAFGAFICTFALDAGWSQGPPGLASSLEVQQSESGAIAQAAVLQPATTQASSQPAGLPQTIDQGFVFVAGRYVDAPYHVEIKGLTIVINDAFEVYRVWQPSPAVRPNKTIDPGMPPGLKADSTYGELMANVGESKDTYLHSKWAYIVATTPEEERNGVFIAYLKGLPPVADARVEERGSELSFRITLKNGRRYGMFVDSEIKSNESPRDVGKELADQQKSIAELLKRDSCVFFSKTGAMEAMLGNQIVAASFQAAIEILESNRPVTEKIELLQRAGILPSGKISTTPDLISNFKSNEQLNGRIKELADKLRVKPLSVEQVKSTIGHYNPSSTTRGARRGMGTPQ
jgi:hypothetical protein